MAQKHFNTAGPIRQDIHYCLDPLHRLNLEDILNLIGQMKYFVLHAPRQTGKTSTLLALSEYLNTQGDYNCIYANLETAQTAREDVDRAMKTILAEIQHQLEGKQARIEMPDWEEILRRSGGDIVFRLYLSQLSQKSQKPVLLFLDEVDALVGDSLISLLRQLRAGYPERAERFPQSVILCGVRDVRDYRIRSKRDRGAIITGGSAFNIKAKSLRLGNFNLQEIQRLYQQHTQHTGQIFEWEAVEAVWRYTAGQPYLVNALAQKACFEDPRGKESNHPITLEMIQQAKEELILERVTHLDQLADKLSEPKVRAVIEPILIGHTYESRFQQNQVDYVRDLGLITVDPNGAIQIANEIYREVIPRTLNWNMQLGIDQDAHPYIRADHTLQIEKLLESFQQFFRENSESWSEQFQYKEAGPQLLLQAFLQRIINGKGRIEREYALGRRRTDLLIHWPAFDPKQRIVIECKLLHKSRETTIQEGLDQTWGYMDLCKADEGHLIIFDPNPRRSWEEKIFHQKSALYPKPITIWGM